MGDKTQLLAMAFATRFRWQTVMWGVFVATLCNHLLAVFVGNYLTSLLPIEYIQVAAAGSFILFGVWTLRGDTLHGEDRRFNYGPFWTVAIAFFFAEMGDKTQLATVALAARFSSIVAVWFGTTSGMLVADAIGIGVGIVLCKRLPENLIKWVAALVFIAFGLIGLYQYLPREFWVAAGISAGVLILLGIAWARRREKAAEIACLRLSQPDQPGQRDDNDSG